MQTLIQKKKLAKRGIVKAYAAGKINHRQYEQLMKDQRVG